MDRSTLDLYQPDFWYALAAAIVVLAPLTATKLRRWAWAAVNLAFLGLLLSYEDLKYAARAMFVRHAFRDAAVTLCETDLLKVCAAIVVAWIVLKAVERRWLGTFPLVLGATAIFALFVLHKLPMQTIYGPQTQEAASEETRPQAVIEEVGLSKAGMESLKGILKLIGYSYVALRLVEVLRLTREGRHRAPDLPSTINYLLPFHMLAAGPIQSYVDFVTQPAAPPKLSASDALRAVERIALGLFKKFVVANFLLQRGLLTELRSTFPYLAVEAGLFYLWLYFDFSAYSDITVGAGRLMGVATPENFNRPYLARNLVDFWDRWHISLSRFIYRNLFLPVQLALVRRAGPRYALLCGVAAFFVSFLLCGLWHELNLRWLLWGGMHASGLVVVTCYRAWMQRRLGREAWNRYLAHRGIRVVAVVLTQAFVAASLLVAFWPTD
jgi:D-alanyl-lipoteichoic acid acyltransferase DltB (MBOAT superfamily)